MPLWNVRDWGATGAFNVYNPNPAFDDTAAFLAALNYISTNKYSGTLWVPAGNYVLSDATLGNQNTQAITISGAPASFGLSLTAGTTGGAINTATASVAYTGVTGTTATNIQNALRGMNSIIPGANGITCVYTGPAYTVTFPASLGAPVMTVSPPTGLTMSIQVLTSGAGLIAQNLYGVRLLGDGTSRADYDLPGGTSVGFSRSCLIWNGTANGIMLHLLGCQDVTIENLAICGQLTGTATGRARTGLLFSKGSGLTCRSVTFTRCTSAPTPNVSGCVQLGLDETETGADATVFDACLFGPGNLPSILLPGGQTWTTTAYTGTGLLVLPPSSVNHQMHACTMLQLGIGAWFQQGGNLQWDRCKADAVGTVLKIGGLAPVYYAGGTNTTTFLMNNVRTNPINTTTPNPVVVDSSFALPSTHVTVQGWDDTAANTQGSPIALVQFGSNTGASTSASFTPSNNITAGDALVVFAAANTGTLPSQTAITDTNTNTWIFIGSVRSANTAVTGGVWYCANAKAGATTITFSAPTGSTGCCIVMHEYSNVDTVAAQALDAFAASGGPLSSNTPGSGPVNGPAGVPGVTYWGGMLVGFTAQKTTGVTYAAGTGFTLRANAGAVSPIAYASEDYYGTGPGPFGATFGQGGTNTAWICLAVALKPATDFAPGVVMGAGPGVMVRDSLASRTSLAREATLNAPSVATPAALRMENLIVPETSTGAALCSALTLNTKVDHVAERSGQYNILRPDVNTIAGRPRYAPVSWLILQQKPKFFYDLGDVGLVAPNQGTNAYISPTVPRSDGQYLFPLTQSVQGIVLSDSVGGFNTRGPGSATPTGYVTLINPSLGLGPISGKPWTLIAVVQRNANSAGTTIQTIISNIGGSPADGGLWLSIDDTNSSKITWQSYDSSSTILFNGSNMWGTAGVPIYIMVQFVRVGGNTTINIYVQGRITTEATTNITTSGYIENTFLGPHIGARSGASPTIADLQIARVATFDLLVPLSAWTNIYNTGTTFTGSR